MVIGKAGIHEREAVFYHSFRQAPFNGRYTICAGLATFIDYLLNFQFTKDDIDYLAGLKIHRIRYYSPKIF